MNSEACGSWELRLGPVLAADEVKVVWVAYNVPFVSSRWLSFWRSTWGLMAVDADRLVLLLDLVVGRGGRSAGVAAVGGRVGCPLWLLSSPLQVAALCGRGWSAVQGWCEGGVGWWEVCVAGSGGGIARRFGSRLRSDLEVPIGMPVLFWV